MAKNLPNSPAASPPETVAVRGGDLRTALRGLTANPFRLLLVLAVNVALVVGITSTVAILRNRKRPPKPVTLAMALGALDSGNPAEARQMAERLAADNNITTEDWGGPDFILGSLAVNAAEENGGKSRAESYRLAALYLARSRERGFPEHRESAGLYLLGKSLCRCGRFESALPVLEQALPQNADRTAEIRALLIEARMGLQPPELDKALADSRKLLSDPQLAAAERGQALVQQAQILLGMNRGQACAAVLDKIPDSPLLRCDLLLLRGRLALSEGLALKNKDAKAGLFGEVSDGKQPSKPDAGTVLARPVRDRVLPPVDAQSALVPRDSTPPASSEPSRLAAEKFRSAVESFRKALNQDLGDARIARQATYLIGLCLLEQGDLAVALNQMERTAQLFPETPESLAALYQQAEIARRMGRHAEAVSAYRRLLSSCPGQDEFHNPWIDGTQLKASVLDARQAYLKAEKYETAALLSNALVHLLPKEDALLLAVQVHRTWGDNLLEQAERLPPEKAEQLRKQARAQFRRVGDLFTEVAREQYATRQYPEQLWNSAAAYLAGHDFRKAAATLRLYMRNESRLRNAQALVDLGEAQLSLGETEQALQSFQECIKQHPRDVAKYQARLSASRAAIGMGDLKQAETFLQDNLDGEQLTPASKEWRDSLFALAELLHDAGRDGEAIRRLDEALRATPTRRKPSSPATCWPTVCGGGRWSCGRTWAKRFPPRSAAPAPAKAAACSNGPWRPTASCKTSSAAAMRRT